MITISPKAADAIVDNAKAIGRLMARFNVKTHYTILKWSKDRHDILTTPDAVEIIRQETGLTVEDILIRN